MHCDFPEILATEANKGEMLPVESRQSSIRSNPEIAILRSDDRVHMTIRKPVFDCEVFAHIV